MGVQTNQSKLSAVVRFTYRDSKTICVTDPARAGRIPTVHTSSKVPRARRDSTVHFKFHTDRSQNQRAFALFATSGIGTNPT
jgi:hypothetical protein